MFQKVSSFRAMAMAVALLGAVSAASTAEVSAAEVNVYTYREPALIQPLFEAFTEKTGIAVNTIYANKGLEERIRAEGRNSPADLLITTDIGRLNQAKQSGITQAVTSPALEAMIPANYRDAEGHWFALSSRARVVYASKERVSETSITYADLADPKWKERLCTRSGQHAYSIGLIAAMIAHDGEEATEKWLTGVRDNLAKRPSGNDRSQVKSIYTGECDIALGNTYYMGLMLTNEKEPEQKEWAGAVKILFPDSASGRGTHVNVSGAIVAKHAPNREEAVKLLEFLAGDEAQAIYSAVNYEYPVNPAVKPSDLVASFGDITIDTILLEDIAKARAAASTLVDRVGFDDGPSS
ncbi:MAG: iron ABC transporter substrate-binding protein [Hyphomicrobiales bacterium]|nr:MAG: iron ABC transporter substrate-binding protein [Hyphomicrobiales bacterium]